jgi:hypothetical protein
MMAHHGGGDGGASMQSGKRDAISGSGGVGWGEGGKMSSGHIEEATVCFY